jgi:cyclopropane-fatty-acyl-phospholipid synthase
VFGITLSKEQLALARERVKEEGLEDLVELQLLDYRDLPQDGRFDKVVSVGMFEHVGHANLAEYCKTLFGAVKEGGLVMNHGITAKHTDGRPVGRGAGDFIEKYVFPNGELPHLSMISPRSARRARDRRCREPASALRTHPGPLERAPGRQPEAAAKEVPDQALRIWRLYLAGCAYAFARAGSTCTRSLR